MKYSEEEAKCQKEFFDAGEVWHLYTDENFEAFLLNEADLKATMGLFGLCAERFSFTDTARPKRAEFMIYTFELMSNHLHVAVKGSRDIVLEFFDLLKRMLIRYFTAQGINVHWNAFEGKTAPVTSLENLRNLLAYINRNGFVVHSEYSPFTYPWGANRFYFNPEIKRYHLDSGKTLSVASRRGISHSRKFDEGDGLFTVDGCVSPMSFCAVDHGERFFRNSSHYFAKVSRNVESYKDIASTIGESIFYTDDDLAAVAVGIAMKKYGSSQLSLLPQSAKIALAKELRCEYNSGAKQISRLLRIDVALVNKMFPRN